MPKAKYYQRPDGLYEAIRIIDGKRKAICWWMYGTLTVE